MKKVAFVFPGQGSQEVGMGKAFYEQNATIQQRVQEAEEALQVPIRQLMFEGPQEELTRTENAQPALFLTSAVVADLLKENGIEPVMVAGHSLGEYSALYSAGSLSLTEGVKLVQSRGRLMEEAYPSGKGAMAAVLGLDEADIEEVAASISEQGEAVDVANFNCPGQIVISGTKQGVELAIEQLKEKGAKRVIPLNVSGPFHSRLMKPASEKFQAVLNDITISPANVPVYANVTAEPTKDPGEISDLLVKQIFSPVRFSETIQKMIDEDVDAIVEVGNGKVLSGLVRKVNRRMKTFAVQDPESLEQFLAWYKEDS
ncbi:ACP S-malonyltransferase [Salirhabdus salicampi]|uniref:ACP S-malonyltransferase n=1 Tax=Salirhabdus salicampi TaxID=476102 RepID=UPI0020C3C598|nr:ACP S-malonyltransferase [Salirhabdus salicampi]MCP8616556.1 ACP S-malonyltransferase [Salirhabdus salicampi]